MPQVVPFEKSHLENLNPRDVELSILPEENPLVELRARLELLSGRGPTFTGIGEDGWILGIGGIALFWPGVAEGWVYLTPEAVSRYRLYLHRAVKRHIKMLMEQHKLRRLQAPIAMDFELGTKWVRYLGFVAEGVMLKYGPDGKDYMMYSIIPGSGYRGLDYLEGKNVEVSVDGIS